MAARLCSVPQVVLVQVWVLGVCVCVCVLRGGVMGVCVCVCVWAVPYKHLTLPTNREVVIVVLC